MAGFMSRTTTHRGSDVHGVAAKAKAAISDSWDRVIDAMPDPNQDHSAIRATKNIGMPDDLADLLPEDAAARLKSWREQRADAHAAYVVTQEKWNEAFKNKGEAAGRVAVLTDWAAAGRAGNGRTYSDDDPSVINARQKLENATAAFNDINARRETLAQRHAGTARLVDTCERYLGQNAYGSFAAHPPVKAKGAIEAARTEIARARENISRIVSAPIHSTMVKAAVRDEIERLAARGRPDTSRLFSGAGSLSWPQAQARVNVDGLVVVHSVDDLESRVLGRASAETPDTLALMAWMHRDTLIAALDREIGKVADDPAALSVDERASQLSKAKADLLAAERIEVALIDDAGEAYRTDTDPRALLGIDGPEPREV